MDIPKSNLVFFLSKNDSKNKSKRLVTNWTLEKKTFSIRVTEKEIAGDFHGRAVHNFCCTSYQIAGSFVWGISSKETCELVLK